MGQRRRKTEAENSSYSEIKHNEIVRKRLAKWMAQYCFRNTKLEDLHAGKCPLSETGDYSDVKVVFPSGEIPWNELSRFDDGEMKALMIEVVNKCYIFLSMLVDAKVGGTIIEVLRQRDLVDEWYDPE